MDSDNPPSVPPPAMPSVPPPAMPSGTPPGMFPEEKADRNKAAWALGLGIASVCCCVFFTGIPGLIVGWPLMKNTRSSAVRTQAKIGVILSFIGIASGIISSIAAFNFFMRTAEIQTEFLKAAEQEIRKTEQRLKEHNSLFDDDVKDDDK